MHTLKVKVEHVTWIVNHNSDWSGEAYVTATTPDTRDPKTVSIPGSVLAACGFKAAIEKGIAALEQLEPPKW